MTISDLLNALAEHGTECTAEGKLAGDVDGYSSIYQYRAGTVTWLRHFETIRAEDYLMPETFACVITKTGTPRIENAASQIWTENPKDAFFSIVEHFWGETDEAKISSQALIEEGAAIGAGTSVGPFTFISAKARIGDRCRIGANVTIKGKVTIGSDCVIQSGAVLGEDGFAFIKEDGAPKFVRHYGGVTLEDHVSIGSQTCVCRGAIDDTLVREYAKIDNLCHIAHNAVIGRRSVVVAGSVVMGSVHVGDDCWVATSMIRDQRHVGNNAVVGMGAVVVKDVPDGMTVAGSPAKPFERKEKI